MGAIDPVTQCCQVVRVEDVPGGAEKIVIFSNACISKTRQQNLTKFSQYIYILLDYMTVKCEFSNIYES